MSHKWRFDKTLNDHVSNETEIGLLERALKAKPDGSSFLKRLLDILTYQNRIDEALAYGQSFFRRNPDQAIVSVWLGDLYRQKGDWKSAADAYRTGLDRQSHVPGLTASMGQALLRLNDKKAALKYFTAALEEPDLPASCVPDLMAGFLQSGRLENVLDLYERFVLKARPDASMTACYLIAMCKKGRMDEVRRLVDYEHIIHEADLNQSEDQGRIETLNARLVSFIHAHPRLQLEPGRHATRYGSQMPLDAGMDHSIAALTEMIKHRVDEYVEKQAADKRRAVISEMPPAVNLSLWTVVMHKKGHQVSHIHPDSVVSGVYFVQIPNAVAESREPSGGWLEFGRPGPHVTDASLPVHYIKPRNGLLVLFPAYLYHATIPLHTDENRISIAFDVLEAP